MGATVAIIAAARQKNLQEIVDRFRTQDATAYDRARSLEELGVVHESEASELIEHGVLVPGRRQGTFYINESAYIVRRDRQTSTSRMIVLACVILLAALLAGAGMFASRQ